MLERLKELEAAATPGPWSSVLSKGYQDGARDSGIIDGDNEVIGECFGRVATNKLRPCHDNSLAIVALRNNAAALIAVAEANKKLVGLVKDLFCHLDPDAMPDASIPTWKSITEVLVRSDEALAKLEAVHP